MSYDTTRARAHNFVDLTGKRFGRWTVLHEAPKPEHIKTKEHRIYWVCRCDCGVTRPVCALSLTLGTSRSCGCLNREQTVARSLTHGKSNTPEYRIWNDMQGRCYDPKDINYRNYGARGIAVCERWRKSFQCFYNDMGPRPSPKHSLERTDNSGNYCPENCRWATRIEQNNNRRGNRRITYRGQTLTIAQWSRVTGIHASVIQYRTQQGFAPEDIFFQGKFRPGPKKRRR